MIDNKKNAFIARCGSVTSLQHKIFDDKTEAELYASDLSKRMIEITQDNFSNPNLHHLSTDTKNISVEVGNMDTVASTNSIISVSKSQIKKIQPKNTEIISDRLRVESFTSEELTPELLREVSRFYCTIFNRNGNYLVFPKAFEFMSPHEYSKKYNVKVDTYEEMYSIKEYPMHPVTRERAIFWHDPETTFKRIQEKLCKDGYVSIMRNNENEIVGFIFGNQTTPAREFEEEGWKNPFYYADIEIKENCREFDKFLSKINKIIRQYPEKFSSVRETGLTPNSKIFGWNSIATAAEARGLKNLLAMTRNFFSIIPNKVRRLMIIGEVRYESVAYKIFKIANGIDVPKVLTDTENLSKEDSTIMVMELLGPVAEIFSLPPKEFVAIRKMIKR